MQAAVATAVGANLVEASAESHLHVARNIEVAVVNVEVVHRALCPHVDIDGLVGQLLAEVAQCIAAQQHDVFFLR